MRVAADHNSIIACLGWGSLVWDPDGLPIKEAQPPATAWLADGPHLPVEFARQSSGNRITLVLVPGRAIPVLWTTMILDDLESAKRALAIRECRRRDRRPATEDSIERFLNNWCGYWTRTQARGQCSAAIADWAKRRNLSAVIWTDLPPRFVQINGRIPTAEQVIEFLTNLPEHERQDAMEYIINTPSQISTDYRLHIEQRWGWKLS